MGNTKPTFDSLTPEQVNDLIATKVMGWEKQLFPFDRFAEPTPTYWYKKTGIDTGKEFGYGQFNPYHSLDDCWRAEERMMEYGHPSTNSAVRERRDALRLAVFGIHFTAEDPALSRKVEPLYPGVDAFHLSAPQHCHALLRAIGEVV